MFKKSIFATLLSSVMLMGFSQFTVYSDSVSLIESPAPSYEIVVHNSVRNFTDIPVTIKWIKIVDVHPSSWATTGICDRIDCTSSITERELTLASGDTTILDVHFFNSGRTGEGNVEIIVFNVADSAGTAKIIKYYGKATNESTAIKNIDKSTISIYPNPTTNYVQIKGLPIEAKGSLVELYSVIGNKIASKVVYDVNNFKMDVQSFEAGIYLVKIHDSQKNVYYTNTFVKK